MKCRFVHLERTQIVYGKYDFCERILNEENFHSKLGQMTTLTGNVEM